MSLILQIQTRIGFQCEAGMKVMTVLGTRPEIVRLAAVLSRLDQVDDIDHVLVHTGQNWDRQLNQVFFEDLRLRLPDHVMQLDTTSLGSVLGDLFRQTESLLEKEKPEAFLVLGDTNSALSLVMAKRRGVPTYHMEAGNRCFDANVPEETNRRIVDHAADFNLAYTEHARLNLLAEGLEPRRVIVTGSPMREVLDSFRDDINSSDARRAMGLEAGQYFLVSAHREENVDSPSRLGSLQQSFNALAEQWGLPVVVSTHPRTRRRLAEATHQTTQHDLVRFHEPFGFLAYNKLQLDAKCVLSDSGTIAEESSILGFPAVTLRNSIERPEALDTGSILMVDVDPARVLAGVRFVTARNQIPAPPADYQIADTSERVVNFILSTAESHKQWSGIR